MRGGGVERGAGRGAQKEARDKVTRMDEGSERKWNRWRRGRREECAGEHVKGKRGREREGRFLRRRRSRLRLKEEKEVEGGKGGSTELEECKE